jgi:hypothetical protein
LGNDRYYAVFSSIAALSLRWAIGRTLTMHADTHNFTDLFGKYQNKREMGYFLGRRLLINLHSYASILYLIWNL